MTALVSAAVPVGRVRGPLRRLEALALDVAQLPDPLSASWHAALAIFPAPIVRARWAARPDVPPELLVAASTDPHPKVRSAAVGNPGLPLPVALRAARTCAPYGPLMVATRPDCPDAVAAPLVAAVGTLSRRRFSWLQVLRDRARGLAGKPSAIAAAAEVCRKLDVELPREVITLLDSSPSGWAGEDEQLAFLTDALGRLDGASHVYSVLEAVAPLRGTPAQVAAVRRWLADNEPDADRPEFGRGAAALRFWCDPVPVARQEQADELVGVLIGLARFGSDPDRLGVVATAVRFRSSLLDLLAGNPAVERSALRRMLQATSVERLQEMIARRELSYDSRDLARSILAEAGVPAPPVPDVLELPPWDVSLHPSAAAAVLEPVLHTAAWPVLAELFADRSRVPLAHLLVTAAAMTGTPVAAAVLAAADRLPPHVTPPSWNWSEDEAPF